MTVVISPGAEARAAALGARAERARDWLAEQLGAPFSFDLYVLDEDEWADHAEIPEYGIPHANPESGKIVLGAQPATLFGSVCAQFWPDMNEDSRDAMHRVYGNPPLLEAFADLVLVHELTHLVPRGHSLPSMWHEELFADLGTVGYLASEEPGELPVYLTFMRAGCDVPPSRFPCSAAMDIASGFEIGGFANYVWYHCQLNVAAERLWDARGVEALRALQAGEVDVAAEVEELAMSERLPVKKTYKLFIGGSFPRSESGRTYDAEGQNVARASRKDVRDAVRAARGAQPGWAAATAYNRGQVVYRIAEMIEARAVEFAELCGGRDEVERSIDRIVWYAGWADKLPQVLGGSNPVAGPYFNFTVPEPTGVVAVLAPEDPPLLGLVTRLLPPLVGGNAIVAVASETRPLAAIELAEALATSDVPGGVVNLLTGQHAELGPVLASHMDVNAIDLCGADGDAPELERLAADNVKRVVRGRADVQSPWEIASFLEQKTVWHPMGQ